MKDLVKVIVDHKAKSILNYFTYKLPHHLKEEAEIGSVVMVPFRKKKLYGWIVGYDEEEPLNVREVSKVILKEAFRPDEFIKLLNWICSYYGVEPFEVIKTFFPVNLRNLDKEIDLKNEPADFSISGIENLTCSQQLFFEEIKKEMNFEKAGAFLIHGHNSHEKINIYLNCIEECLRRGKDSIVMVPEVSLTPELVEIYF